MYSESEFSVELMSYESITCMGTDGVVSSAANVG